MDADIDWILSSVDGLTDEVQRLLISEWAEQKRYLPPELTSKPGMWDNNYAPYLVKPMNSMGPQSPVKKIIVMKGHQVCCTTGLLENPIGYTIDHYPCGVMYVNADEKLTKDSVELKIDKMIQYCDLKEKIKSQNKKKTGDTTEKKEFIGGFILSVGGRSPRRARTMSVRMLVIDEVEGLPAALGDDADTIEVFENRTSSFDETKKILILSTPLVKQTSIIEPLYLTGDQQKFFIPCPSCNERQYLRREGVKENGDKFAFDFKVDEKFNLIPESVVYICEHCGYPIKNHEKTWFLRRGVWVATATPTEMLTESYHIPSFLAPVGIFSWESMVQRWLRWWDVKNGRVKDIEKYRSFKNTVEGETWEERGSAPKFERVVQHRRAIYSRNEIKNSRILLETGSKILILTLAADIHKDRIDLEIVGWCRDGRSYSIDWRSLGGDTEDLRNPKSPWVKLSKIIEEETWKADDNEIYNVTITFIDAGYRTEFVYEFCNQYEMGVYPVFDRDTLPVNKTYKNLFMEGKNKLGNPFYSLNITTYKDRLAAWLRSDWNDGEKQPVGYPNYPSDYGDDFFRMYESEQKFEKKHKITKQRLGFYWQKIKPDNHAWACRVYGMAGLDFYAFNICTTELGLDGIVYDKFWTWLENQRAA